AELSHLEDSGQCLQRRAEAAEGALQGLVEIVSRYHWGALYRQTGGPLGNKDLSSLGGASSDLAPSRIPGSDLVPPLA
ncbi:hypothetical protein G0U57_008557, partial [Chelydra serpentina]